MLQMSYPTEAIAYFLAQTKIGQQELLIWVADDNAVYRKSFALFLSNKGVV